MARSFAALVAVAALLTVVPLQGAAQGVSVNVVAPDHDVLDYPLVGAAVSYRKANRSGASGARLGAEFVTGTRERFGSPCVGLVLPGSCPDEPLRDRGSFTTVSLGLVTPLFRRPEFALELIADLRGGAARSEKRGQTSGRGAAASKGYIGPELGLEARWLPLERAPLALEIAASAGGMLPMWQSQEVDSYTPFESLIPLTRLRIGVSWSPRPR